MAKLDNTPSWSESRVKCLRECRAKYYFTYYLAWGGWERGAGQESQQAYMLKKMTSLPMWAGSIVHDVIQGVLSEYRKTGKRLPEATAIETATQALRKGWIDSTNKRWQKSPSKAVNLSEHFYEEGIPQDKCDQYKLKVHRCIRAFYNSDILTKLRLAGPENWLTMEEFQSFAMKTGEVVVVKLDFAYCFNGLVYLIDWKTGRPTSGVVEQLTAYAMYALKMGWAKRVEDIRIVPVFLDAEGGPLAEELSITAADLERQANIVRQEYPMLTEAHMLCGDRSRFPVTDESYACRWCNFRKICSGPKTTVEEGATPF